MTTTQSSQTYYNARFRWANKEKAVAEARSRGVEPYEEMLSGAEVDTIVGGVGNDRTSILEKVKEEYAKVGAEIVWMDDKPRN